MFALYPEFTVSFLDNLENNLKSLESHEEGNEQARRQQKSRDSARVQAQALAPHAEELKKGPYTAALLSQTVRVGHAFRTKIHIAWIGSTLRLEARGRRLELRPTASGVVTVRIENHQESAPEPLDLKGSPEDLIRSWLAAAPAPEVYPEEAEEAAG
jgi:hypothetical protein